MEIMLALLGVAGFIACLWGSILCCVNKGCCTSNPVVAFAVSRFCQTVNQSISQSINQSIKAHFCSAMWRATQSSINLLTVKHPICSRLSLILCYNYFTRIKKSSHREEFRRKFYTHSINIPVSGVYAEVLWGQTWTEDFRNSEQTLQLINTL